MLLRALRSILTLSLLLPPAARAQSAPAVTSPIVGTWEAIARSTGGLGTTISFGSNNTLTFTVGQMVDMQYRRAGDSLFVNSPDGSLPPASISVVHDTLVVTRKGSEQHETRISDAIPGDPLIGLWTYKHYTGVAAYEEYAPDGAFHLRVPIRTLTGNYVVGGNTAVMHLMGDGGGDRTVNFAVAGDTLQLSWNGQTTRYLRVEALSR